MCEGELFSFAVKSGEGCLIAPHFHDDAMEFIEVLKGNLRVTVGLREITVPEGGILHFFPGVVHYAVAEEECLVRVLTYRCTAGFAKDRLDEQILSLYLSSFENQVMLFTMEHALYATLASHMENAIGEWRGKELFSTALILAEISYMLVAILRAFGYGQEEGPELHNRLRIAQTVKYIDASYAKKLRLEDLAATLYLSPDHFGKLFRATVGLTPVEYVNYVRVNAAMRLLAKGELSVSEIAKASGFASVNYFQKVFRDFVGIGPATLRRNWQAMHQKQK